MPPEPQPLGPPTSFSGAKPPTPTTLKGRYAELRPLAPADDAQSLYELSHAPTGDPRVWTYLYEGPYPNLAAYREDLHRTNDGLTFTVLTGDRPAGTASYLAITPEHGSIEIGNIWFGPSLQKTRAATEAIYLLAKHAFDDLHYRRLEWKCNSLNQPSRKAAARFGFEYEGTFQKHRVVKGRSRDTAWFAITDDRWPPLRQAFETWLDPENFDAEGRQRSQLTRTRAREGG
ncbi:MAG: GNAT family N-acetyltransferase [Solirubrobacterales bacterium]|nr:GNAT family N-acetyltransferase [Solirubrobacterales bacterium]